MLRPRIPVLLLLSALALGGLHGEPSPFVPGGVYITTVSGELPPGLPTFGSWVQGDAYQGEQFSPWVRANGTLAVYVCGYPRSAGQQLSFEWKISDGSVQIRSYRGNNVGEVWTEYIPDEPAGAIEARWHAVDHGTGHGGWFGVSDFKTVSWWRSPAARPWCVLVVFLIIGLLLAPIHLLTRAALEKSAAGHLSETDRDALAPLFAYALVSLLGYGLFWLWFCWPAAGRPGAWLLGGGLGVMAFRSLRQREWKIAWLLPHVLATVAGGFYLVLLLHPVPESFAEAGANRFVFGLPIDNDLPGLLAKLVFAGKPTVPFSGDWLAGDRPPLQAAWVLWTRALLPAFKDAPDIVAGVAGLWFQLSWVGAFWCLARMLGLTRRQSVGGLLLIVPLGFLLLNTVYVWPKLGAASLMIGAFGLVLGRPTGLTVVEPVRFAAAGAMAALANLAHGGTAFALLGALPFVLHRWRWWKSWLCFAAIFALLTAPWTAYQRIVDPPSDRLLKWHLAGVIAVDPRSFPETLVDEYRRVGWRVALESRRINLMMQGNGNWFDAFDLTNPAQRRRDEMENFLRSASLLLPAGLAAWAWLLLRKQWPPALDRARLHSLAGWTAAIWGLWLLLLFQPGNAVSFHGTYIVPLIGYTILAAGLIITWPRVFFLTAILQWIYFALVWLPVLPEYLEKLHRL